MRFSCNDRGSTVRSGGNDGVDMVAKKCNDRSRWSKTDVTWKEARSSLEGLYQTWQGDEDDDVDDGHGR